jgi:peptidoglycan/LPS O-acetylase OafA/YrhL
MVHFPLLRFLTHNYGDWFGGIAESSSQLALWPLAFGVFALLIAVSSLCYHAIEVPCRDWVKRRVRLGMAISP